jgi:hypothetical protein
MQNPADKEPPMEETLAAISNTMAEVQHGSRACGVRRPPRVPEGRGANLRLRDQDSDPDGAQGALSAKRPSYQCPGRVVRSVPEPHRAMRARGTGQGLFDARASPFKSKWKNSHRRAPQAERSPRPSQRSFACAETFERKTWSAIGSAPRIPMRLNRRASWEGWARLQHKRSAWASEDTGTIL